MIVAWWKEGVGSAVTLLSLLAFYLVHGYLLRNHISGWAFLAFASRFPVSAAREARDVVKSRNTPRIGIWSVWQSSSSRERGWRSLCYQ